MPGKKIIDITLTLGKSIPGFKSTVAKTLDTDGWNASTLEIYSHAGTHMDAPIHFEVNELTIDEIPVERLVCVCHIIRIASCRPGELLTIDHLGEASARIQPGEALIFHTGWSKFQNDPAMYRDRLPRISRELAHWIADREVAMIGVEPPSIADVNNLQEVQEIHRILMKADVIILEGLCNLEEVTSDKALLIALPLKIGNGDGAPVRAIIIENFEDY